MRKFVILAALAASALPVAANAQNWELRRDRQEIRQEQRDLRQAYRYGDRRDIRNERRDLRDARREYREDRRDYRRDDWRGYRYSNRNTFRGGRFYSPYRYRAFAPGYRVAPGYWGSRYVISDPWRYRLPRPGYGLRWVRFYNDVLLIDTRSGRVVDVHRSFYW